MGILMPEVDEVDASTRAREGNGAASTPGFAPKRSNPAGSPGEDMGDQGTAAESGVRVIGAHNHGGRAVGQRKPSEAQDAASRDVTLTCIIDRSYLCAAVVVGAFSWA